MSPFLTSTITGNCSTIGLAATQWPHIGAGLDYFNQNGQSEAVARSCTGRSVIYFKYVTVYACSQSKKKNGMHTCIENALSKWPFLEE